MALKEVTDPRLKAQILAASQPVNPMAVTTGADGTMSMPVAPERVLQNQQTTGSIGSTAVTTAGNVADNQAKVAGRNETAGVDPSATEQRDAYLANNMRNALMNIRKVNHDTPGAQTPGLVETIAGKLGGDELKGYALQAQDALTGGNHEAYRTARTNLSGDYNDFVSNALTLATGAAFKDSEKAELVTMFSPIFSDTSGNREHKWLKAQQRLESALLASGKSTAQIREIMKSPGMLALQYLHDDPSAQSGYQPMDGDPLHPTDSRSGPALQASTTEKNVPIPPEMQQEFDAFLQQHPRGKLDNKTFQEFIGQLAPKYKRGADFDTESWIKSYNDPSGRYNSTIQPGNRKLSDIEADSAAASNSAGGVAGLSLANAGSFGLSNLIAEAASPDAKQNIALAQQAHPDAAMVGDVAGSVAPVAALEKVGAKALEKMPDTVRRLLMKSFSDPRKQAMIADVGANAAYGAARGGADDDATALGGAFRGGTGAVGGRFISKGLPKGFGGERLNKDLANLEDVKLTNFQGSGFGRTEETLGSAPFVRRAREKSQESLHIANVSATLKPLGHKLPAGTEAGDQANKYMHDALNQDYEALKPRLTGTVDSTFNNSVKALGTKAYARGKEAKAYYREEIAPLYNTLFDSGGKFTGQSYKDTVSKLRAHEEALLTKSENHGDVWAQDLAHDLRKFRKQIVGLVGRNDPEAGLQLAKLETAWAKKIQIEDASRRASANGGIPNPSQLMTTVRKYDTSANKGMSERGTAKGAEFARSAQRVMGSKGVPDTVSPFLIGNGILASAGGAAAAHGGIGTIIPVVQGGLLAAGLSSYVPLVKDIVNAAVIRHGKWVLPEIKNPLVRQIVTQALIDKTSNRAVTEGAQ